MWGWQAARFPTDPRARLKGWECDDLEAKRHLVESSWAHRGRAAGKRLFLDS